MRRRGLRILRRMMAGMLLLTLASAYAQPSLGACPATPVASVSSGHSACEHESPARCAGALVCVSISPALVGHAISAVAATGRTLVVIAPPAAARDLVPTGPPTPPPNTA